MVSILMIDWMVFNANFSVCCLNLLLYIVIMFTLTWLYYFDEDGVRPRLSSGVKVVDLWLLTYYRWRGFKPLYPPQVLKFPDVYLWPTCSHQSFDGSLYYVDVDVDMAKKGSLTCRVVITGWNLPSTPPFTL